MKKHKNKIISAIIILAALTIAFLQGGNYGRNQGADGIRSEEPPASAYGSAQIDSQSSTSYPRNAETDAIGNEEPAMPDYQSAGSVHSAEHPIDDPANETADAGGLSTDVNGPPEPDIPDSPEPDIPDSQEQDRYHTDPIPEGRPAPVEPQDVTVGDGSFTVTLSVRVDTILDNMSLLNSEKHELVPPDGVIFPATEVTAYEGESVFKILQREMRRARIHMEFRNTPIYNSAYIMGINNLYEFDTGELSGWMYKVNGWFPNYGASRYQLQPGDVIEWHYTCDLGRDLGEFWLGAAQPVD